LYILFSTLPLVIFSQTKIKSFYFESDQSVPTPYSQHQLDLFKQSFNRGEISIFEIYAYTDSIGSPEHNDSLARKRLNYVSNYLGIINNESVQLKPYGLIRKYDVKDYKSWRRVDVYFSYGAKNDNDNQKIDSAFSLIDSNIVEDIRENNESDVSNDSIDLISRTTPYVLKVEFIEGTAKMDESSHVEVSKLYDFLINNPKTKILIRGHVCCGKNMRISRARAKAVYDELRKRGMDKKRMDYVGLSNKEPLVYPEKTPEDRQRNRRVDVKITSIN